MRSGTPVAARPRAGTSGAPPHPRRGRPGALLALAALGLAACAHVSPAPDHAARAAPATAAAPARAVGAVDMTVADVARSTAFFVDVLGFEKLGEATLAGEAWDRLWGLRGARAHVVRLRLGDEQLELTEFATPKGRPYPPRSRSNDRWFQHVAIVVADMDAAYARVGPRVRAISTGGPQTLPASTVAAAGISAFYFRDPDGHALELIHFPPGKGDPRWQHPAGRLFLGIDHTAIGIAHTDASLAFYRDALGLAVGGTSFNVGAEQERLTGVPGARVHITGLHAAAGHPGVEFLEYAAPSDGRPTPSDLRTSDVGHWQVTIVVRDLAVASQAVRAAGASTVSDGVVTVPGALGFERAVLVRDPDGHAVQLVEP